MISHMLLHHVLKGRNYSYYQSIVVKCFPHFLNYVYVYDQVWVCACEHRCPEARGTRFPETGVKGGCEFCAMHVGVGNQIQSSGSTIKAFIHHLPRPLEKYNLKKKKFNRLAHLLGL